MLGPRASFFPRDTGPLKRSRRALSLATFLVWTGSAQAASVAETVAETPVETPVETVVILRPSSPSADVTQALTLVRGELLSLGLEVTISDRAGSQGVGAADSVAWLEPFAARGASAVIEAIGDVTLEAVDVWVVKMHPQRFEVTRVAVDPRAPAQPEVLALRAVEALRAGLLQTDWAARKRRSEPGAELPLATLPASVVQASASTGERVALEVGAAGVMSLDGLGPALLPTVRAGWAVRRWLLLQASAAGLGSRSRVVKAAGKALVGQQYVVVGARYHASSNHRWWPFLGLAAGVLHTSVEGQDGWGTGGHPAERWSGLVDVSLGAGLRLYGRTYLTLAAHAQIAAPYVAIYLADTSGATSGRPNLLLTLTVGAWL